MVAVVGNNDISLMPTDIRRTRKLLQETYSYGQRDTFGSRISIVIKNVAVLFHTGGWQTL